MLGYPHEHSRRSVQKILMTVLPKDKRVHVQALLCEYGTDEKEEQLKHQRLATINAYDRFWLGNEDRKMLGLPTREEHWLPGDFDNVAHESSFRAFSGFSEICLSENETSDSREDEMSESREDEMSDSREDEIMAACSADESSSQR